MNDGDVKYKRIPDNVDEHLVAGRTLNTAWGAQRTTNTSSGVNAFDLCFSSQHPISHTVLWLKSKRLWGSYRQCSHDKLDRMVLDMAGMDGVSALEKVKSE